MLDTGGTIPVPQLAVTVGDVDPVECWRNSGGEGDEAQGWRVTGGVGVGDVESQEGGRRWRRRGRLDPQLRRLRLMFMGAARDGGKGQCNNG